jgi:predicted GNAT family acetyltransferase
VDIDREERDGEGRYHLTLEGHTAEMTYSKARDGVIVIDHTLVPESLEGRGLGLALVKKAIDDARSEGRKILPLCSFAKTQFDRNQDWHDVLQ